MREKVMGAQQGVNLQPAANGRPPVGAAQAVKKLFFDSLSEVKEAPKPSKTKPSAYIGYGRLRFAQEVKTLNKPDF